MPKIICIGRNYADHAKELGNAIPTAPVIFMKPDSAILPKNKPFFIPDFSENIQFECELLIRINRLGKRIEKRFAHKYYQEIGLGIDFTARDLQNQQKEKGLPWEIAKGFDGSAVIGKWFNKDLFDLTHLNFTMHQNELEVQKGNTSQMLNSLDSLIAYISQYFTLKIGDVIFTGTPAGVGKVNKHDILKGKIENEVAFEIKCK